MKTAIYQLITIFRENKIKWSISKQFYKKIKQNIENWEYFSVCLYWHDFINLLSMKPLFFKANSDKQKNLLPYFIYNQIKINIHLIIPTSIKNAINSVKNKEKYRILYWGDNKKSFWVKLNGFKTAPISPMELVNVFYYERYTEFIITDSNIQKFEIYNNLNWNNILPISISGLKLPYFKEFNSPSSKINW